MTLDIDDHARARQINVLVIIDTAYVKYAYGKNENISQPRHIAREGQFMVSTGSSAIIHAQETGELQLPLEIGDRVAIRVTSLCGNTSDAVIPYRVRRLWGTRVFAPFEHVFLARDGAVQPDPDSPTHNGLPPLARPTHFSNFDSTVIAHGTERFEIVFALYVLSSNGQCQDPFGYYAWNPTISIV